MVVRGVRPSPIRGRQQELARGANKPGWGDQQGGRNASQYRPREEPFTGQHEVPDKIIHQQRLRDLAQSQHEGPDPRIILDLEAQVRVGMHLGEEMRVRALREEPVLGFQFGHHALIRLMKQAQLVEAGDTDDDHATDGEQWDHKFLHHIHARPSSLLPLPGAQLNSGCMGMARPLFPQKKRVPDI